MGKETIQFHYMDTDSFILGVSIKDIIKDIEILEDIFDFSNLNQNHEIFSNKFWKVIGK